MGVNVAPAHVGDLVRGGKRNCLPTICKRSGEIAKIDIIVAAVDIRPVISRILRDRLSAVRHGGPPVFADSLLVAVSGRLRRSRGADGGNSEGQQDRNDPNAWRHGHLPPAYVSRSSPERAL